MCCLWMYFFWTNINYRKVGKLQKRKITEIVQPHRRQSIFRFKHEKHKKVTDSTDALNTLDQTQDETEPNSTDSPSTKSKTFPIRQGFFHDFSSFREFFDVFKIMRNSFDTNKFKDIANFRRFFAEV